MIPMLELLQGAVVVQVAWSSAVRGSPISIVRSMCFDEYLMFCLLHCLFVSAFSSMRPLAVYHSPTSLSLPLHPPHLSLSLSFPCLCFLASFPSSSLSLSLSLCSLPPPCVSLLSFTIVLSSLSLHFVCSVYESIVAVIHRVPGQALGLRIMARK